VRQCAREKLAADGEGEAYRLRHRDYFLALAEQVRSKWCGPEQAFWLEVLETEHDNMRAALDFCLHDTPENEEGLRLITALHLFWLTRGYWSEGREWSAALLAHPCSQTRTKARAEVLQGSGMLARVQGDYASAQTLLEESLAINRKLGDRNGIAATLSTMGIL